MEPPLFGLRPSRGMKLLCLCPRVFSAVSRSVAISGDCGRLGVFLGVQGASGRWRAASGKAGEAAPYLTVIARYRRPS